MKLSELAKIYKLRVRNYGLKCIVVMPDKYNTIKSELYKLQDYHVSEVISPVTKNCGYTIYLRKII